MVKLTCFLLALTHVSSVRSLPANGGAKRDANIIIAREITLTDVSVTTSYSTAIASLQSVSPTGEPSNSGVCYHLKRPLQDLEDAETNYQ